METKKIFDKETILDLMVNFIPLGIILFFIVGFVVVSPWGFELRTSGVMLAIMGTMFVALAILTYISAKAIAGDEKKHPVYAQGQAGLKGAKTRHEQEEAIAAEEAGEPVGDAGDASDGESGGDASDDDTESADAEGDNEVDEKADEKDAADGETDGDTADDEPPADESETTGKTDDNDAQN